MNFTRDEIKGLLLGLFGASGPLGQLGAALFPSAGPVETALLSLGTLLTPLIAGFIFMKLQSPANAVASVATLSAAEQHAALDKVDDSAKVLIAQAVPSVSKIITKDDVPASSAVAQLAASDDLPKVVSETDNIKAVVATLDNAAAIVGKAAP